ncbi:MAG: Txe/YoeB family addiction module toxin [Cytophagaceae bacterium]|nr:Txe/YoeB family addiction module toxin [Cytophagaceae bacterium]
MRRLIFEQAAFDDYADWALYNRAVFKRTHELLKDIRRQPFTGIGKPEPLKGNLSGWWSRRITDEHRLVYKVESNGDILIASVKGHYE